MHKNIILFILCTLCILLTPVTVRAEEITEINRTLNQNWITKEEYNEQVEEAANVININDDEVNALITVYPKKLDPRETGQVTSVKNQEPYGTCWSYAPVAASESALIKQGFSDNSIDLSELQYIYEYWKDKHGQYEYEQAFDMGATVLQVWEYMAGGIGPYYEKDFGLVQDYDGKDIDNELLNSHLYDLDYIKYDGYTSAAKTSYLKNIIMDCGGACISYYSGNQKYYLSNPVSADDDSYNNTGDSTYYNPHNIKIINHAVEVVGWDDDYPASNFATEPEGNGAWLIKNSWGEAYKADFDANEEKYLASSGEERAKATGYYWISYYESSIMDVAGVGVCFTKADTKTKEIETPYDEINIKVGETFNIEAVVKPDTAKDKALKFSSSDKNIATVKSTTGVITAKNVGSCIITIRNNGGAIYSDESDGTVIKTVTVNVANTSEENTEENTSEEIIITEDATSEEILTLEEQTSEESTTTENTTASPIVPENNTTETESILPIKEEKTTEVERTTITTEAATKDEILVDTKTTAADAFNDPEITTDNFKLSKVYITSLKKYKSRKIKVSYKRVIGATKYEIQVSKKKNFKKKNVYYSKTLKAVTNKVKRNKKYYVRVRAVYEKDNIKIYGKWSKTKKAKIK